LIPLLLSFTPILHLEIGVIIHTSPLKNKVGQWVFAATKTLFLLSRAIFHCIEGSMWFLGDEKVFDVYKLL